MDEAYAWAAEQYGAAELGDLRRTVRLVELAAACARKPGGVVTGVSLSSAQREGAYRFLESKKVDNEAVAAPMFAATARRCAGDAILVVSVDQATISFVDRQRTKQLGRTATRSETYARRGFQVMNALGVRADGESAGLLAQQWYVRREEDTPEEKHWKRPFEERESFLWFRCIKAVSEVLKVHAPRIRPWLQMDRGADSGDLMQATLALGDTDFTIRSNANRTLLGGGHLHDAVRASASLGRVRIAIPSRLPQAGMPRVRHALFALRACRLHVQLNNSHGRHRDVLPLTAVHVREVATGRRKPIEWTLLTNRTVDGLEAALQVVTNYRSRWRVEEFHRAWKSGVCCVEQSQLRSASALRRWATILAAVATRAEQLKSLSRAKPLAPATEELSTEELDAIGVLSRVNNIKCFEKGEVPSLERAVEQIALLGGYTGRRNSGGPPGATTIQRGLHDVLIAAAAIAAVARSG